MSDAPSLAPITVELIRLVEQVTGRPTGNTEAPHGAAPPYSFLSRVDTIWSGSLAGEFEMATVVFQLQCIGLDAAGVEWLEHRARIALDPVPVFAGWSVIDWEPLGSPGGIRPDRDVTPHLYFSTPQWRLIAMPT